NGGHGWGILRPRSIAGRTHWHRNDGAHAMHVMLTGATGFLGGHLLARLIGQGVGVTALVRSEEAAMRVSAMGVQVIQGSIEDPASLRAALAQPTDAVFHVAADTSSWRGHRERQTRTNVEGTRNVIDAAQGC